jgi:hypothetical protein
LSPTADFRSPVLSLPQQSLLITQFHAFRVPRFLRLASRAPPGLQFMPTAEPSYLASCPQQSPSGLSSCLQQSPSGSPVLCLLPQQEPQGLRFEAYSSRASVAPVSRLPTAEPSGSQFQAFQQSPSLGSALVSTEPSGPQFRAHSRAPGLQFMPTKSLRSPAFMPTAAEPQGLSLGPHREPPLRTHLTAEPSGPTCLQRL